MQTSGQFGVPPPEVPSPYTAVNKNINTHGSNNVSSNHSSNNTVPSNRGSTTCTPAGNQAQPGHQLLFNLSPSDQQPQQLFLASPSAFAASTSHGPPSGEIMGPASDLQEQNDHLLSLQAASAHHHQKDNTETTQIKLHQQHSTNLNQLASMNLASATQPTEHEQQRPPVSLGLDQSIAQITNGTVNNDTAGDNDMVQSGGETMAMAEMDQGDDGAGSGNRWPRQETLALLKIRADMDALFRDTSVKRPLWDEVSRKLGELGYERSAKKCKEKFENVNKYYKRTKEGKAGRQDGKNYRFFSQLEALAANNNPNPHSNNTNNNNSNNTSINNSSNPMMTTTSTPISSMLITNSVTSYMDSISRFKAGPSDVPLVSHAIPTTTDPSFLTTPPVTSAPSLNPNHDPAYRPVLATNLNLSFESSDEDDDADVDDDDDIDDEYDDPVPQSNANAQPDEGLKVPYRKRKRTTSAKMMDFFEGLLNKVIEKQEQMQQKFLQALEKRETDRMIREEAWRRQEMARLSKENELRAQERTSAATRDAALIAFLQKVTGQNVDFTAANVSTVAIAAQPVQTAPPLHHGTGTIQLYEEQDLTDPGSKRWLREEVLALIDLHNSLQSKFTEAGPKGPLWEEIAQGMTKLGFSNRTAKRCKEKWENINKYFKRAKESNKKRPENAKTCPYFHELEAIHNKGLTGGTQVMTSSSSQQLLQLPYKPMMEYAHADIDSVEHKPSASSYILEHNGRGDRNITPSMPVHGAASLSIVNANTGHANIGNSINNGALQSKATTPLATGSVQLAAGAAQTPMSPAGLSPADRPSTNGRGGPISDLGLNMEHQTTPALLDLHQHEPNTQGAEVGSTQSKESGPSLAPLPNSSSFMSNMLPKLSSNNSSAPSASIQGQ